MMALPYLTRALQMRRLVPEGEEMTLDEKIAALFRKGSPNSADAEPAPSICNRAVPLAECSATALLPPVSCMSPT